MTRAFVPDYSVIIPAHDEADMIAATLAAIGGDPALDLLVMCNGCRDDTAGVARRAAPGARVIEREQAGKAAAINQGIAAARHAVVLVVDADIPVTRPLLDALAAALAEPGVMAASPAASFDLKGADRWVRAYYRAFEHHDYLRHGVGGSGIWGLSAAGRAQMGPLPDVIADDGYVRHFFSLSAQRRVSVDAAGRAVRASVRPPATLGALIRTEARWRAGDAQVRRLLGNGADPAPGGGPRMAGARPADRLRYRAIKVAGRLMLFKNRISRTATIWHRDRRPA